MSGGLTTYTGEPPECAICQGQTVVGGRDLNYDSNLFDDDEDSECLHEKLEETRPSIHKGEAHMISCPCPKCTPRC